MHTDAGIPKTRVTVFDFGVGCLGSIGFFGSCGCRVRGFIGIGAGGRVGGGFGFRDKGWGV